MNSSKKFHTTMSGFGSPSLRNFDAYRSDHQALVEVDRYEANEKHTIKLERDRLNEGR